MIIILIGYPQISL